MADARPARVRGADRLPAAAGACSFSLRLPAHVLTAASFTSDSRRSGLPARIAFRFVPGSVSASIGQGIFGGHPGLPDAADRVARAGADQRRHLDRAREADPRPAGHDARQHAGHGPRQALLVARLRLPADLSSVPLMSLVFAFGGVAPEDVIRRLHRFCSPSARARLDRPVHVGAVQTSQVATAVIYVVVLGPHRRR